MGVLLQPDVALENPLPPTGSYKCRTVKLGSSDPATNLSYVVYPWFDCVIADSERGGGSLRFTKTNGSQRPIGTIFKDQRTRGVFLGTMQLTDETAKIPYGRDMDRNLAGFVERVAPSRWRILFPRPHFESVMDVMELVPAGR